MRLQVTPTQTLMVEAAEIALKHGITAYDGCYVVLTMRSQKI
ncbi:hypothetical protein [Egbenema bharatensis]